MCPGKVLAMHHLPPRVRKKASYRKLECCGDEGLGSGGDFAVFSFLRSDEGGFLSRDEKNGFSRVYTTWDFVQCIATSIVYTCLLYTSPSPRD